jgi:hypothetical protein
MRRDGYGTIRSSLDGSAQSASSIRVPERSTPDEKHADCGYRIMLPSDGVNA